VLEYIKMRPGSVATGETILDEVAGELVFDDVSFVYPTRREHPVLENFDFTIPAGKVRRRGNPFPSFWTVSRACLGSTPTNTRHGICSTWCPC